MKNDLKSIVITGASGFIGRNFCENLKEHYQIYGIGRRSRREANIPYHPNLHWIQCDISNFNSVKSVIKHIQEQGGAEYFIHLAAFYDFSYQDNPAYESVNIKGTENMLKFADALSVKRFIFASSLAACKFPESGELITEKTEADADFHYARSKRIGEDMVKNYSQKFPCSIIRFAAVFSDWCEYAPLYKFMTCWLGNKLESRVLAGEGESSVPYIHINDLCSLLNNILDKSALIPQFDVYNASPCGSTSHKEIFKIATRYYFGEFRKPFHLPKILAYPALYLRKLISFTNLTCNAPIESTWMIKYIDKQLEADSTYTQHVLDWKPTPRYHLSRRLLFLIETMKSHREEWLAKNESALKRVSRRANLIIYEKLMEDKDILLDIIVDDILYKDVKNEFAKYKEMETTFFHSCMSALYHLLLATVRTSDRGLMLKYIDTIAMRRFAEGFEPNALINTLTVFKERVMNHLMADPEMKKLKPDIFSSIALTLQIAQDEIEDLNEKLLRKLPIDVNINANQLPDCEELQRKIRQLSAFYQVTTDDFRDV